MSDPFIGEIKMVGFNFAPRGWTQCNGQLLAIIQNTALFSLLGTTYGGDGRSTFGIPDLQGRVPIHAGDGPGLSRYQMGQRGGAESTHLTTANLPSHNHSATLKGSTGVRSQGSPENNALPSGTKNALGVQDSRYASEAPNLNMSSESIKVNNTGGNELLDNRVPFLTINFCIALQGIFPSRN